jgi:sugar phosphate isomerase/epimerase
VKLGMVTFQLGKDWDVPTIIEKLTQLKYQGAELRTTHAHGVEDTLSKAGRAEVRKRFADSPIELVQLGTAFHFHYLDQSEVRASIEGAKRYIELAKDVGAQGIKVQPNAHNEAKGVPREKTLEQIGVALRECGRAGADNGVLVRMEMHGTVADAVDMKRIIDLAPDPSVCLVWNSITNFDVDENGSVAGDFTIVKDRLGLVHLHDLYDEEYPWVELLGLLKGSGYDGYCMAECNPPTSDPERVLRYFRALFYSYLARA